jgi:hypothetical protein
MNTPNDRISDLIEAGCPQCGGEPTILGELGFLTHLRCRQCGWTWHHEDYPTTKTEAA